MDFKEYLSHFSQIIEAEQPAAPYDAAHYMEYTKLNWSRMNRWLKKGELNPRAKAVVSALGEPQEWILITEPWCGDAAHSVPFIHMLAETNPRITLNVELRDQPPHRIEEYLTNGARSIPKLVVRDANQQDVLTWGPRPAELQAIHEQMKVEGKSFEDINEIVQKWYNADHGQSIQQELADLLSERRSGE